MLKKRSMSGRLAIDGRGREPRTTGNPLASTKHGLGVLALPIIALALVLVSALAPATALANDGRNYDAMFRLYNQWTGEHLYTEDRMEYYSLGELGWSKEDVAWHSPVSYSSSDTGVAPVYRLYNKWSGDHFYTEDKAEYDSLGEAGWNQEYIAFYSDEVGKGTPIYRLYNPWVTVGTHLFTTDKQEYDYLQTLGWQGEGIAFYGLEQSTTPATDAISLSKTYATLYGDGELVLAADDSVDAGREVVATGHGRDVFSFVWSMQNEWQSGASQYQTPIGKACATGATKITSRCDIYVTDDDYPYLPCWTKLTNIEGLARWDVSRLTTTNIYTHDLERTAKVGMFSACSSLQDLSPLAGWDVSNVTRMDNMFSSYSWLPESADEQIGVQMEDLDALASWDVSNVTYMQYMFGDCTALRDVSGLALWDVSNVDDSWGMYGMFSNCSSLSDCSPLDAWNMSPGSNSSGIFYGSPIMRYPTWYQQS